MSENSQLVSKSSTHARTEDERNRDKILRGAFVKISGNTHLLKPRMLRSIYRTMLPRIRLQPNKDHSLYVGTPGTSMSHTLDRITELLIPGTYMVNTTGPWKKSERMITIYHELPDILAPEHESTVNPEFPTDHWFEDDDWVDMQDWYGEDMPVLEPEECEIRSIG